MVVPLRNRGGSNNDENDFVIFPMEFSLVIVYAIFSVLEFCFCVYTMCIISDKQSAVFLLRNTKLSISNTREKIKTSQEIEQELFYKFPYLQKNINGTFDKNHLKNN